ncbi:hypothetical protein ACFQ8S_27010 [Streptomyces virginiae]|uniref:hypothetical protein n=1 Tax=Streptomyces virginiae TaxID=1961 RepID=UPI0036CC1352
MGNLEMSTGDMRVVIRLLTAVERTPEQERVLAAARERCARTDARLADHGVTPGVTVARDWRNCWPTAPARTWSRATGTPSRRWWR